MLPIDDSTYEWIEQYLREELSPEEVRKFEDKLKTDKEFLKAFKTEKDLFVSVAYREEQQLEGFLNSLHNKEVTPEKTSEKPVGVVRQMSYRKMLLAAAAVITGMIFCFYFLLPQTLTNEQIAANYYEKPAYEQIRAVDNTLPNQAKIQSLYKTGDYKQAIVLLNNHKNNPTSQLYRAICHYELNQTDKALAILSSLQANPDFDDEATWYRALFYLKSNNGAKARIELQKLSSGEVKSTPKRTEKAKEILGKL